MVRPVSRVRWMLGRLGISAVAVVLAGALGGIFSWLGVASQGVDINFPSLLASGLNSACRGLRLLGIGALVWGCAPRLTSVAVYGVLAWAFLVELLAGISRSRWLLDSSILHHLSPAPAVAPDWTSNAVMIVIGLGGTLVGALAFSRARTWLAYEARRISSEKALNALDAAFLQVEQNAHRCTWDPSASSKEMCSTTRKGICESTTFAD